MYPEIVIKNYIVLKDNEARIAGKEHLKAELVARMVVDGGRDIDYVMEHYGLSRAHVHAALAYYYENQEVLDNAHNAFGEEPQTIDSVAFEAELRTRMKDQGS